MVLASLVLSGIISGMTDLIMIPALGCDAKLYAGIVPLLPANVQATTIIAQGSELRLTRFEGCGG